MRGGSEPQTIEFVNSDGQEDQALVSEDGFVYRDINSDGQQMAQIIGYAGSDTDITVPETIGDLPVLAVALGIEQELSPEKVTGIHFPANTLFIRGSHLERYEDLAEITVAEGNATFFAEDNVLYRNLENNECEVALYPSGKHVTEWTMSPKVTERFYFEEWLGLETVTVSPLVENYRPHHFNEMRTLKNINVPDTSEYYSSVDGVLFESFENPEDGKNLVCYPPGRTAEEYTVPDGVTSIDTRLFIITTT